MQLTIHLNCGKRTPEDTDGPTHLRQNLTGVLTGVLFPPGLISSKNLSSALFSMGSLRSHSVNDRRLPMLWSVDTCNRAWVISSQVLSRIAIGIRQTCSAEDSGQSLPRSREHHLGHGSKATCATEGTPCPTPLHQQQRHIYLL